MRATGTKILTGAVLVLVLAMSGTARAADPCGEAYMKGYALLQEGETTQARSAFEQALELADKPWKQGACLYRIAETYQREKKLDEALTHYGRAAAKKRDDRYADDLGRQRYILDALDRMADIAPSIGKSRELRQAVERLLKDFPNLGTGDRKKAYLWTVAAILPDEGPAAARTYLENAIQGDRFLTPKDIAELRGKLADLLKRMDAYGPAADLYAAAAATPGLGPGDAAEAIIERAKLLVERIDPVKEGRRLLQDALRDAPAGKRGPLLKTIAWTYEKQGEHDEAFAIYQDLVADGEVQMDDRIRAADSLAKMMIRRDAYDDAKAMLVDLRKEVDDAGKKAWINRVLFDRARDQKDYETALAACDNILELREDDAGRTASMHADALKRKSDAYRRQGMMEKAIAVLEQGLKLPGLWQRDRDDLTMQIAERERDRERYDVALARAEEVAGNDGADNWRRFRARQLQGDIQRRAGKIDEAEKAFRRSLEVERIPDGHKAGVLYTVGEMHREADQPDAAIENYDEVLMLAQGNDHWQARALERIAHVMRGQKRPKEAAERLAKALKESDLAPRYRTSVLWAMAEAQRDAGMEDALRVTCQAILELDANGGHVKRAQDLLDKMNKKE